MAILYSSLLSKGPTNIWLMLRLVCTFFLLIFANVLKGFMKPPWIIISIVVHSTCYEVLPFFWPEVIADLHLFLAFILHVLLFI